MLYHRIFVLAVVGMMAIGIAGCASTQQTAVSDHDIANQIKQNLESPSGPEGPFDIDIWVRNGSVTLDGTVPSTQAKEQAMEIAQSANGVEDVKSFLETE